MLIRQGDVGYIDLIHELNEIIHVRLDEHRASPSSTPATASMQVPRQRRRARMCTGSPRATSPGSKRARRRAADRDAHGHCRRSADRRRWRPVRLTVVVACRLCDHALDDQVLCTVEVAAKGGPNVAVSPVGDLRLKGVADLVSTAELVG